MLSALFAIGAIIIFMFILLVLAYIPFSLGLYRMAMKCGVDNAWLAWIPIAQFYVLGLVVRELRFQNYEVPRPELVLPAALVVYFIVSGIPVVGFLYFIAYTGLMLLATYRLFFIFKRENALLFTLLSLIPLVGAFLVLSVSKYDPEF